METLEWLQKASTNPCFNDKEISKIFSILSEQLADMHKKLYKAEAERDELQSKVTKLTNALTKEVFAQT